MGPPVGRDFTGQKCVQKLPLGERGLETHTRCGAGEAQKIRPAGLQRLLDEEHEAQLIEEGFDLADTKILDDAIFELIERGTGELRRTRKLRLSQAFPSAGGICLRARSVLLQEAVVESVEAGTCDDPLQCEVQNFL